jgi:hypothetical protein
VNNRWLPYEPYSLTGYAQNTKNPVFAKTFCAMSYNSAWTAPMHPFASDEKDQRQEGSFCER